MDPTLRKRMVICTPFGKFVNGEQHGVMCRGFYLYLTGEPANA